MRKIIILLLTIIMLKMNAQQKCGADAYTSFMKEKNSEFAAAHEKVNTQTKLWIKNNPYKTNNTIITIPVVVHVVWKTSVQNISYAQIQSQIDVLNEDYGRTNIDQINTPSIWNSIAADCEIQFCLAAKDPNGQATSGIERIQTTHGPFGMNNDINTASSGGADDWPNDDYLNIWICDIQSGLLGFASSASSWIGNGDGLVIGYKYFGKNGTVQPPYNKGRTATHEIGHWLNLQHIWGDSNCGDDQVSDTPVQEMENYSCPSYPLNSNSCTQNNPHGDMFMNFMDYTNDACMNLFTDGQKSRMIATINQYRPNMLNHNLCTPPTNITEDKANSNNIKKIIDVLGRERKSSNNQPLLYIYDDGKVEKRIIIE